MPFIGLKKTLRSKKVKRECQNFTSLLHSGLQKIQRSKTMKRAAEHLNTALCTALKRHEKNREKELHCHHHQNSVSMCMDEVSSSTSATMTASSSCSRDSSWAVAGGENLGDVDMRAERFIVKFREELRLEGQRSIEESEAMLAHGM